MNEAYRKAQQGEVKYIYCEGIIEKEDGTFEKCKELLLKQPLQLNQPICYMLPGMVEIRPGKWYCKRCADAIRERIFGEIARG